MMILPSPNVLDRLIQDHNERLPRHDRATAVRAVSPIRVRVGHALIAVGASLSGERVEQRPARHSTLPKAA